MAYSTEAQLKANVELIEKTYPTAGDLTTFADERIAEADKRVKNDVQKCVDVDSIPDVTDSPATPDFINLLSQFKAAELSLVRLGSVKRSLDEINDVSYWQGEYKNQLEKIKGAMVPLELSDGTNISTGHTDAIFGNKDVKPKLGYDKYGTFADADRLEDIRDTEQDEYAGDSP